MQAQSGGAKAGCGTEMSASVLTPAIRLTYVAMLCLAPHGAAWAPKAKGKGGESLALPFGKSEAPGDVAAENADDELPPDEAGEV